MSWWEYVSEKSGGATQTDIAARTGLTQPTVNRWRTSKPKVDNVVAFARAYDRSVLEAFVAAELISKEDAQMKEVEADLGKVATDDLLAEIRRRIKD